jgi:hypothetical protein
MARTRGGSRTRCCLTPKRPHQRGDCSLRRAAVWLRLPLRRHCGRESNRPKSTLAFRFQRGPNAVAWPGYRVVSASIATVSARISAGSSPSVISTP